MKVANLIFRVYLLSTTILFSSITYAQDVTDCSSFKVAVQQNGSYSYFDNLNQTISGLNSPAVVFLGNFDSFGKITISGKSNLKVQSNCTTKVRAFVVSQSSNVEVSGLEIDAENSDGAAIVINQGSQNITIKDNKILGSKNGIIFKDSSGLIALNNEIKNNENDGIYLENARTNIQIKQNIISENKRGIAIQTDDIFGQVTLENNAISKHPWAGVRVLNSNSAITFINNTISENQHGINIADNVSSQSLSFSGNTLNQNLEEGLYLDGSFKSVVASTNTISNNKRGVYIQNSNAEGNVDFNNNTILGHEWANIRVQNNASNLKFSNNNISGGQYGIRLFDNVTSSKVEFISNSLSGNSEDGLLISGSFIEVKVSGNTIEDNKRGVLLQNQNTDGLSEFDNNTIRRHEWANIRVQDNASDLKFSNNTISEGQYGIRLFENVTAEKVEFLSNTLNQNTEDGIIVNGNFDEVAIANNNIENNKRGILLQNTKDSGKTDLDNNTIKGHEWAGVRIDAEANNITFTGNEITENNDGVRIFSDVTSGLVTFNDNKLNQNGKNGLFIEGTLNVFLTENELNDNGTDGQKTNGYGIKKDVNTDPSTITLIRNFILNNNGKVVAGISSIDLNDYTEILDPTDKGNTTTNGNEGPGVGAGDTDPPVMMTNLISGGFYGEEFFNVGIEVSDESRKLTKVFLNHILVAESEEDLLDVELHFSQGNNIVKIESEDEYGNKSTQEVNDIFVDSIGPQLTFNYQDGQNVKIDPSRTLQFSIQSNEVLNQFTVSTDTLVGTYEPFGFNLDYSYIYFNADGIETFTFVAEDIYGNVSEYQITLTFEIDDVRPVITLNQEDPIYTNNEEFVFDVSIADSSNTTTRVVLNGAEIQVSENKDFTVSANLALGKNTITVTSVDEAGNIATPVTLEDINFDDLPINLTILSPSEGEELENFTAQISGNSDKELASVTVNGQALQISNGKLSFTGNYEFDEQYGELNLLFIATDIYGNTSRINHPVFIQEIVRKNLSYITDSSLGKIYVYNSDDLSLVREIALEPLDPQDPQNAARLSNIELSVDKKRAFVIQAASQKAVVVDLENDQVVLSEIINLNANYSESGTEVLVPNKPIQVSDNGLYSFVTTAYLESFIPDGETIPEPEVLGGLLVYDHLAKSFSKIEVSGIRPESIQVDSSGSKVYMSTGSSTIAVVDISNQSLLETITINASNVSTNDLLISNDGNSLFVSSSESNLLYRVDVSTKQLLQSINLGGSQEGLVRIGTGNNIYALVLKNGTSYLSTIDETSNIVSQELDLGFIGTKIKTNLDGTKIWATSESSNQVKVIDLASNSIINTLIVNSPLDIAFGFIDEKSTVNIPPLASFDYTSNQLIAPAEFNFNGSKSKDLDGTISSYSWNVNGSSYTVQTVNHRFQDPGTYEVSLTVTDNSGTSRTKTIDIEVADRTTPPTSIFYTRADNEFGQYKIVFDASKSFKTGGEISEYRWDFGDGKTGLGKNVIHEYEAAGTYLVSLVVTDNFGFSASSTKSVNPADITPLNLSIFSPLPGTLTNESSVTIIGSLDEVSDQIKIAGSKVVQNADKSFSGEVLLTQQGVNIFRVEALDSAGNNRIINLPVIYDSIAPVLSNPQPQGVTLYQQTGDVLLNITSNESLKTLTANGESVIVNNNAQRNFAKTLSFLDSGTKNIEFIATDLAGNEANLSSEFELVIDNVAPVITFNNEPQVLTNIPSFQVSVNVEDETPVTTQVLHNGSIVSNGATIQWVEGENTLSVSSTDSAGNESTLFRSVVLDTASPSIQLSLNDGFRTNQSSVDVTSRIYDLHSTVSGVYLNGNLVQSSTSPMFSTQLNLQEGTNLVVLTSQDELGNIAQSQSINIILDTTSPVLSNIRPETGIIVGLKTLDLFLSAESNEPLKSLIIDGQEMGVNIGGIFFSDRLEIFGDGPRTLTFTATDLAGNQNTFTHNIETSLDNSDPIIQITGISDNQELSISDVLLAIEVQDSSSVNVQLFLNDKFIFDTTEKVFNYSLKLNEGVNNLKFKATDSVDRTTESIVQNVKLDTKGPVLSIASPVDAQEFEDSNVLVSFTSNEPMNQVLINGNIYSLGGSTSFNQSIETNSSGAFVMAIEVSDNLGNITSASIPISILAPSSGDGGQVIGATDALHTCVAVSGQAFCWGENPNGELGDGTQVTRLAPVAATGMNSNVTAVESNYKYSCFIKSGELFCSGSSGNHNIGSRPEPWLPFEPWLVPQKIEGLGSNVTSFQGTSISACAVDDGAVYCWGSNFAQQLGLVNPDPGNTTIEEPTIIPGAESGIVEIVMGGSHQCSLDNQGIVKCWGRNNSGSVGNGTTTDQLNPTQVIGINDPVTQISAAGGSTCATTNVGGLWCWGSNANGKLGDGTTTNRTLPIQLYTSGIKQVSVGSSYACAVDVNDAAYCWGSNSRGQLGNGVIEGTYRTPGPVVGLDSNVDYIIAGTNTTCASKLDNSVMCWGGPSSNFSQPAYLGDGTTNYSTVPVSVIGLPSGSGGGQNIIANISATPIRGKAPLTVELNGNGSNSINGTIVGYSWELENTVVSTDSEFNYIFNTPGPQEVKLTVTDSIGATASNSVFVIVEEDVNPTPLFTHNLNIENGIVSVSFDASSSFDPDGEIQNYSWNFGDGNTGSGETIVHQYSSEGTYSVELTVTSNSSQLQSVQKQVVVKDVIPPILTITSPVGGSDSSREFVFAGYSSEKLQSLRLNNSLVALNSDQVSFSKAFTMNKDGQQSLEIEALDLSGNKSFKQVLVNFDSQGPILTGIIPENDDDVYTQNGVIEFFAQSNERLSSLTVNGVSSILTGTNYTEAMNTIAVSNNEFTQAEIIAKDMLGNETRQLLKFRHERDNSVPSLTADANQSGYTQDSSYSINIIASDNSLKTVEVWKNGTKVHETSQVNFVFSDTLSDGDNSYQVKAIDKAENTAVVNLPLVTLDNQNPIVYVNSPSDGDTLNDYKYKVVGSVSEPLSSLLIGGKFVAVNPDLSFEADVEATSTGNFELNIEGTDLAGNTVQNQLSLSFDLILIPDLISVTNIKNGSRVLVVGREGATKANTTIKISPGFFSSSSTISNESGEFAIEMKPFSSANIKATNGSDEAEANIIHLIKTRLAGLVKNIDGQSLAGVKVRLSGSNKTAITDISGAFNIDHPGTGDQVIMIDPTALNTDYIKYSPINLNVSIGYNRDNILEAPIYLAPIVIDGSETLITEYGGTVISNPNVPGVSVNIPSGVKATFPGGENRGVASILKTSSEMSLIPVPEFAVPKNIIHLEPSGLSFSEPVELILPNVNELAPGVELAIMSMDVKKGTWDVNGFATVDPSGSYIKTKEGNGITHFSPVFALPFGAVIRNYAVPGERGINSLEGGVFKTVSLPSFKSLGSDIVPKLIYNSSWAAPRAIVTNYISMPKRRVNSTGFTNFTEDNITTIDYCFSAAEAEEQDLDEESSTKRCFEDFFTFWKERTVHVGATKETAWYQPESIKTNFTVGSISTDVNSSSLESVPPNLEDESTWGEMPIETLVSFGVDLVDENNTYFPSGIYPSRAHYEIELREMKISSRLYIEKNRLDLDGSALDPLEEILNVLTGHTARRTDTFSSRILDEIVPFDLVSPVYVQNKINSEVGRGWKVGGVKKIINPGSNRILLEDDDGSLQLYNSGYKTFTVAKLDEKNINLEKGVSFNWPKVAVIKEVGGSSSEALLLDLEQGGSIEGSIGDEFPITSGQLKGAELCPVGLRSSYPGYKFTEMLWSYRVARNVQGLFLSPGGKLFGTDAEEHSLFEQSNSSESFKNLIQDRETIFQPKDYSFKNGAVLNSLCESKSLACTLIFKDQDPPRCPSFPQVANLKWMHKYTSHAGTAAYNNEEPNGLNHGTIPVHSAEGLNSPMGIIGDGNGFLYVADTGNNRVLKYDIANNSYSVIAGSGRDFDEGDGGLAIEAGIYHPRGLALDDGGNIYITSERGLIRKVDTSGVITRVAGADVTSAEEFELVDSVHLSQLTLGTPTGILMDSDKQILYVADTSNNRIVQIDLLMKRADLLVGSGESCSPTNVTDSGPALGTCLQRPSWLGFDDNNELLIADALNNRILRVTLSSGSEVLSKFEPKNRDNSVLNRLADGSYERIRRDGTRDHFNEKGLHEYTIDRANRKITFKYNSDDRIEKIIDPVGQEIVFNYSGDQIHYITTPSGDTTLNYSGSDLEAVIYPDGTNLEYSYNEDGLMVESKDQRDLTTKYEYNIQHRLKKTILPDESEVIVKDHLTGTFKDPTKDITKLEPIGDGGIQGEFSTSSSQTIKYDKDLNGYIYKITDPSGATTVTERDVFGNIIKVTRPDDTEINHKYDKDTFDLLESTDSLNGDARTYKYDIFGQIVKETRNNRTELRVYDESSGLLKSISLFDGGDVRYEYDSNGLVKEIYKSINNDDVIAEIFERDPRGNIIQASNSTGKLVKATYDDSGNILSRSIRKGDNEFDKTIYTYDLFNRVTSVTSPRGEKVTYGYDPTGQLLQVKDAEEGEINYTYDSLGRVASKSNSLDETYTYIYDGNGNLSEEVNPRNQSIKYIYDNENRLLRKSFPGDEYVYDYNDSGQISTISNNNAVVNFEYDDLKRTTRVETLGNGDLSSYPDLTTVYTYNSDDQRVLFTDNHGSYVKNEYLANGKIDFIQNTEGKVYNYSYDLLGRATKISLPGLEAHYSYNNKIGITSIDYKRGVASASTFSYSRNDRGIIEQESSSRGNISYTYDSNQALAGVSRNFSSSGGKSSNYENELFEYDDIGNRTKDKFGSYTYDDSKRRLVESWKENFSYDSSGNLIGRTNKSTGEYIKYEYSPLNQLKAVRIYPTIFSSTPSKEVDYFYDGLGRRLKKVVKDNNSPFDPRKTFTRQYGYDVEEMYLEFDENSKLLARYTHSSKGSDDTLGVYITRDGEIKRLGPEGSYTFLKDQLGSIIGIANSNGEILQEYDYSVYGEPIKINNGSEVDITENPIFDLPFSFANREWDKEVNLFYSRARYYDPDLGRFLQEDAYAGKLIIPLSVVNRYIYANNSPVMYFDPLGNKAMSSISRIFNGGGGDFAGEGTSSFISGANVLKYMNDDRVKADSWKFYAAAFLNAIVSFTTAFLAGAAFTALIAVTPWLIPIAVIAAGTISAIGGVTNNVINQSIFNDGKVNWRRARDAFTQNLIGSVGTNALATFFGYMVPGFAGLRSTIEVLSSGVTGGVCGDTGVLPDSAINFEEDNSFCVSEQGTY